VPSGAVAAVVIRIHSVVVLIIVLPVSFLGNGVINEAVTVVLR
jgi:hypothetical protein